ncbi:MAG: zinc-ribbon domain-containing protein [Pararhodobacter sp.]
MRLTCPNCKAQYEVDDAVIPDNGRDVQCSACGHTWYQYPVGMARTPPPAESAATNAAPDETDADAHDDAAASQAGPRPGPAAPRIEKSVLDVLREEAAREIGERRKTGAPLETQGDLGLVTRPRPQRAQPRDAADTPRPQEDEPPSPAATDRSAPRTASRRNLLPDIEELSSTLEPGREPRRKGTAESTLPPTDDEERRGFRKGFTLVLLIAIVLGGLYSLAPLIAGRVPALAGGLDGYVALVDSLHAALRDAITSLIERMRGAS